MYILYTMCQVWRSTSRGTNRASPVLQVTLNWRGQPLLSHEVVVELIAATTGLTVQAGLDQNYCATGIKITDKQLRQLPIHPHDWHGQWNYPVTAK